MKQGRTPATIRTWFAFPNPVNEHAARLVASGVVIMCVGIVGFGQRWILWPLAYGFLARVLAGPRWSPLGQLVTRVIVPAIGRAPRLVAGPPKRFAQAIGLVFSATALTLQLLGADTAARVTVIVLAAAATLEAVFGVCLGCLVFARLMKAGIIPTEVCAACENIWSRPTGSSSRDAATHG